MLKYEHLTGIPFKYGEDDCLQLLRRFYKDNFNINFPNYARPDRFWEAGLDLYSKLAWKEGFRPLHCHPSDFQMGDLILIAINSSIANHAAVFVDDMKILHHVIGCTSTVEPYGAAWRNRTLGIYRHPDVKIDIKSQSIDLYSLLPDHKKRQLDEVQRSTQ